ncbi:MAG: hypothetical protein U1E70_25035 [Acetobacteraceae bacterium]
MAEEQRQDEGQATGTAAEAPAALFILLDALAAVSRHMHPPRIDTLASALRPAADALRQRASFLVDPALQEAATLTLRACDALQAAPEADNPIADAYRAMRLYQRAISGLIAHERDPAISRFLLPPAFRDDARLAAHLAAGDGISGGVFHTKNDLTERGGFSVYIPPHYDAQRVWPLVVALHGGSGHGRLFLSNWVPLARALGVVVVAPTAVGSTWSLMQPEVDAGNIIEILAQVADRWQIDRSRMLLTGMSDGGTFTLLSGLDEEAPFTHLAPVAASFHPLILAMAEPRRLNGLPVYLVHGALDWMFPVSVGRTAARSLAAAGAAVVYREVADLSHTYPVDEQEAILDWLGVQSAHSAPA